jgi:UDP-2,3-diacylglucosamine pyrophosphatase LpxH
MRTLILSDLHLGSKNCHVEHVLHVFDRQRCDRLILNGDTLHSLNLRKLTPEHWAVVNRLRQIGRDRDLVLLRGNHDYDQEPGPLPRLADDFAAQHVLPSLLGVPMIEDYQLDAGGRSYLVLHGDRFDPSLNGSLAAYVGAWCFHLTRKLNKKLAKWLKKKSERWGGIVECIREQAVAHAQQKGFDGIVTGHTHFPEDTFIGAIHYLNTGSWTEPPCTYATIDDGKLRLHQLGEI